MEAKVYGHPASLKKPEDFNRLEQETGLKAIIGRACVKLISPGKSHYDLLDMSAVGGYPKDAA